MMKFTVGAGAYGWWNDEDAAPHDAAAVDADHVRGVEISGGLRGRGVSIYAEFEHIVSRAAGQRMTTGLYAGAQAVINRGSIEAGDARAASARSADRLRCG